MKRKKPRTLGPSPEAIEKTTMSADVERGAVVIRFSKPTTMVTMSPQDGQGFAQMITKLSQEAFVQSLQIEVAALKARNAELEGTPSPTPTTTEGIPRQPRP